MNQYSTFPVTFLFDLTEAQLKKKLVTRIPVPGEYVHFNSMNENEPRLTAKVLGVTHLVWDFENMDSVAEIHCVVVDERTPDHDRANQAKVIRAQVADMFPKLPEYTEDQEENP